MPPRFRASHISLPGRLPWQALRMFQAPAPSSVTWLVPVIKAPMPTEAQIHQSIVQWLRASAVPGVIVLHVPNGSTLKGGAREWQHFERLGAVAGVPDLLILGPDGRARAIEVKAAQGALSESQKDFAVSLRKANVPWYVCRSLDEAQKICRQWGLVRLPASLTSLMTAGA